MKKNIFREVALKQLSSPEQLDELIRVTSPRGWLAMIAISLILISAVVWGFLGSIPTKIEGQGLLLNNGGVFSLKHHTSGRVLDVRIKVDDTVKKGDVIARIELPVLEEEINGLQSTLSQLEISSAEYQAVEKQVLELREELDYKSQVVAEMEGRVLELNIEKGDVIEPGESLVILEQYGDTVTLEGVIYVPAEQGGKIFPGMEVQVCPTIINKEEYGFILGRVQTVSDYPATTESMMQTLGNEKLVSLLTGQGAPLMVRVELVTDDDTISGYKWSTSEGPPISIHSGLLIQSEVVVNRVKPISKVLPLLGQ